jgi:hypothetical protein
VTASDVLGEFGCVELLDYYGTGIRQDELPHIKIHIISMSVNFLAFMHHNVKYF